MVKKAYDDVFNNKKLLISEEQANMTIQKKLQEFMAKKQMLKKKQVLNF